MARRSLRTPVEAPTSTSYGSYQQDTTTTPRPTTITTSVGGLKSRPRTAASVIGGVQDQEIICGINESRGVSPVVGLAFVNLTTTEAVLCQITDSQTYVRTLHKLAVYDPTEILLSNTTAQPRSKLYSFIEQAGHNITVMDRKYWSEITGMEYIRNLALKKDVEAIKVSLGGNFYATCCFAAVFKFIEIMLAYTLPFHSLRIKFEPSEGSMMIDLATIRSLELIQNLQNAKSKDCLFGLLNHTLTPMGVRLLRSNILQPMTNVEALRLRYEALEELTTKEDIFFAVRQALKEFVDVDRVLTAITIIPKKPSIQYWEQSINNVLMIKQCAKSIPAIFEALGSTTTSLLSEIRELCSPEQTKTLEDIIDEIINEDTSIQSQPLDLRNQRTYAVKAGVNGLLDVARLTYKEANDDAYHHVQALAEEHQLALDIKYETARQYYIRIATAQLEERNLPEVFINAVRRKKMVECQTMDLLKWNQKIMDSHLEVLNMSEQAIQALTEDIRENIEPLFHISEAIALLDIIAGFAQLVTMQDYCKPEILDNVAIKSGRHPIIEKIHHEKFVPNDAYATQQSRFQIITGCNMSGKSTYVRSIALMAVMAQIGCFVPASYAAFPITHQLFARISSDDSIEANVSTFAAEMREAAFILSNIDKRSLVIIDELGRGTSTRDGLCIAIAIAEALIESHAFVWFATHFRDLARILAERNGVVNMHLAVEINEASSMKMLYRISSGFVQEQHYGIALAKVLNLPADVIQVAEKVSRTIARNAERKKKNSKTIAIARRRKLVLGLREQLKQAEQGNMQGKMLWGWLERLQDEFVIRMSAIEEDMRAAEAESEGDEDSSISDARAGSREATSRGESESETPRPTRGESAEGQTPTSFSGSGSDNAGVYYMSGALPPE